MTHIGAHIGQAILGEEIAGPEFSEQWITLSPNANLAKTEAAVRAVGASFPGTFLDVTTYLHERINETISNTSEDLVVRILGPNFGVLQRQAQLVTDQLSGVKGLVDVHPQSQGFIPQIQETVNAATAQRYGLTPGAVRRDAAAIFGSQEVGDVVQDGRFFGVSVYSTPASRRNLSDVSRLLIDTPGGSHVALGKVANLVVNTTPSDITRYNGSNNVDVLANVAGSNLGSATSSVRARLAKIKLPLGYRIQLLGEAAERQAAQHACWRWGSPPRSRSCSSPGGVCQRAAGDDHVRDAPGGARGRRARGLGGRGHDLPRSAGRILCRARHCRAQRHPDDQSSPAPRARGGRAVRHRARDRGASERLSPIMMTALATGLALAPLVIFGDRPGQEIENPMAIVIVGGLATSTLMNLFMLPSLYLRFGRPGTGRPDWRSDFVIRRRKPSRARPALSPESRAPAIDRHSPSDLEA